MIRADQPAVVLAPMEGVTDAPMRALQGELGGFQYAVAEYFRISQNVPASSVFLRHIPELATSGRTLSGLPVQVQLLGGDPDRLAAAAVIAHRAGAWGIDLNFGCPAKTVNRHDGGATLLKYPHRIKAIVSAVRQALPPEVPVSAKLRLGWDCVSDIETNATMAAAGGASWLTIHARTRMQRYDPPAHWSWIGKVRANLPIPVVANGDIWTLDDFRRCRDETGCIHFMLGRGALANPYLSRQMARALGLAQTIDEDAEAIPWHDLLCRLKDWTAMLQPWSLSRLPLRWKQWLRFASEFGGFPHFDRVKTRHGAAEILAVVQEVTNQHEPMRTFATHAVPCSASATVPWRSE